MSGIIRYRVPLFLFALFSASSALAAEVGGMAQENGVLENAQVVLLFLGTLVFLVQSFAVAQGVRHLLWIGAWVCFTSILRELDIEEFALPQWVILLGSGKGRDILIVVGWLSLGTITIKSLPGLKGRILEIVRSRTAIFTVVAGIALFLGLLCDREVIGGGHPQLFEEVSEVVGYFLLLLAALFSRSISKE